MISVTLFSIARILLFFVSTIFIFKNIQAVNLEKIFKANSTEQIRFLFAVISVILGYLFTDALVSLFEYMNNLI